MLLTDADGDEITLALLGRGEVVGEMSLIDDDLRSATVVTLERVSLLALDRDTYDYFRRDCPRLIENLIRIVAKRLRRTNAQLLAIATQEVPGRICRQLIILTEAYGQEESGGIRIQFRLTQEDISHLVGATRVSVNGALGKLRRDELIDWDNQHRFLIRDLDALEAMC